MESALYEMDGLLKKELTVGILTRYVAANERFHKALPELVHAPLIRRLMRQVVAVPFASPNAFFLAHVATAEARQVLMTSQEQHHTIIEAIAQRQGSRRGVGARECPTSCASHNAVRDRESFDSTGAILIEFPAVASPKDHARGAEPIARPDPPPSGSGPSPSRPPSMRPRGSAGRLRHVRTNAAGPSSANRSQCGSSIAQTVPAGR
jgi:hypothetical protein